MAVSAKLYGLAIKSAFNGEIDYTAGTIKVMLTTSSYTPNQDTHQYKSSVTNEVSGTGYTAGGATLASKTISYNTTTNVLTLDAADTVWTTSTITARYAVVYLDTGTSSTSPLIGYVDFGADVSSTTGTFTLTWDATGIVTVTVS